MPKIPNQKMQDTDKPLEREVRVPVPTADELREQQRLKKQELIASIARTKEKMKKYDEEQDLHVKRESQRMSTVRVQSQQIQESDQIEQVSPVEPTKPTVVYNRVYINKETTKTQQKQKEIVLVPRTQISIMFKLNGEVLREREFASEEKFSEVRNFVKSATQTSSFQLYLPFPKRLLESDMDDALLCDIPEFNSRTVIIVEQLPAPPVVQVKFSGYVSYLTIAMGSCWTRMKSWFGFSSGRTTRN